MSFEKWIQDNISALNIAEQCVYAKVFRYRITRDEVHSACLVAAWKLFNNLEQYQNVVIEKMLTTYSYNTMLSFMQTDKVINKKACFTQFHKSLPLEDNDFVDEKKDLNFEDKEIVETFLSLANDDERKYIQSVFYDGLTIVNTAKLFNVHAQTVAYHLRNFIKRIRKKLNITEKKISLSWNVGDFLSHERSKND